MRLAIAVGISVTSAIALAQSRYETTADAIVCATERAVKLSRNATSLTAIGCVRYEAGVDLTPLTSGVYDQSVEKVIVRRPIGQLQGYVSKEQIFDRTKGQIVGASGPIGD